MVLYEVHIPCKDVDWLDTGSVAPPVVATGGGVDSPHRLAGLHRLSDFSSSVTRPYELTSLLGSILAVADSDDPCTCVAISDPVTMAMGGRELVSNDALPEGVPYVPTKILLL